MYCWFLQAHCGKTQLINQNGAASKIGICFAPSKLGAVVLTVPTKSRLEARFCNKKKFKPHCIYEIISFYDYHRFFFFSGQ